MKKLSIVCFFSGGASGLKYLIEQDVNMSRTYTIAGTFTDNQQSSATAEYRGTVIYDYESWCIANNCSKKDMKMREKYFSDIMQLLQQYDIDLILLSGFMLKIPPNFIAKFQNRIINVHPADLRIKKDGKPRYTGDNAVKKALDDGKKKTYSTVHFVTDEVDCGQIIAVSKGLEVEPGISVQDHQAKMKTACDGPVIARAISLIAAGKVRIGV